MKLTLPLSIEPLPELQTQRPQRRDGRKEYSMAVNRW
jgi:hypothetical protein